LGKFADSQPVERSDHRVERTGDCQSTISSRPGKSYQRVISIRGAVTKEDDAVVNRKKIFGLRRLGVGFLTTGYQVESRESESGEIEGI